MDTLIPAPVRILGYLVPTMRLLVLYNNEINRLARVVGQK